MDTIRLNCNLTHFNDIAISVSIALEVCVTDVSLLEFHEFAIKEIAVTLTLNPYC